MGLPVDSAAEKSPQQDPLLLPDYTPDEVRALRAVANGTANPEQCRLAIKFLIEDVCATYQTPFRGVAALTDFACGKQWVGQAIVVFLKTAPLSRDPKRRSSEGEQP